jgi:hypothetical protein
MAEEHPALKIPGKKDLLEDESMIGEKMGKITKRTPKHGRER